MLVINVWMGEFPWYCKCYIASSYYAIAWPWLYLDINHFPFTWQSN